MAISSTQFCFLALLASFAIRSDCSDQVYPKPLFIFGDSLFDAGNNNYINTTTDFQANFSPYGESFFKYPSGRFSDGRLIPDFIAEYAMLPLIPPFLQAGNNQLAYFGMNFASSGSGVLDENFPGLVINLNMQLSYFKNVASKLRSKLGNKEAKILLSNAVYLFSVGSNDYLFTLAANSSVIKAYGTEKYVQTVMGNLTSVVKEIYKEGGRKFGFLNLGSLGCLPSLVVYGHGKCMEDITALTKLHNVLLSKKMKNMEKELKGFYYSIFNFSGVADMMTNRPSKYRFKEVESACCGSGPLRAIYSCGGMRGVKEFQLCDNADEYFFFDAYHPTEAAYRQFADIMWNGDHKFNTPRNLKSLFELPVYRK